MTIDNAVIICYACVKKGGDEMKTRYKVSVDFSYGRKAEIDAGDAQRGHVTLWQVDATDDQEALSIVLSAVRHLVTHMLQQQGIAGGSMRVDKTVVFSPLVPIE